MGIMLFLGNSYYAWQAIRMKNNNGGRDFTAQPYGLNTVGGFPFAFGIALSVYLAASEGDTRPDACLDMTVNNSATLCENAKFELAWEVTVASNFLTGLLNILAGIAGEHIVRVAPTAAMIVPLAGIGFTWLALNQIAPNFSTPAVGFLPMFLIFVTYYAKSRITLASWRVPEALHVVFFFALYSSYSSSGSSSMSSCTTLRCDLDAKKASSSTSGWGEPGVQKGLV